MTKSTLTTAQILATYTQLHISNPSGMLLFARGGVLLRMLVEQGVPVDLIHDNFVGTRTIFVGDPSVVTTVVAAHGDQISLIPSELTDTGCVTDAFCTFRAESEYPGAVLRFDRSTLSLVEVGRGIIVPAKERQRPTFNLTSGIVSLSDTIVYQSDIVVDGDLIHDWMMDNLIGLSVLYHLICDIVLDPEYDSTIGFLITDEEEGPVGSFGRGAARAAAVLSRTRPGLMWINVDGHDAGRFNCQLGGGAYYARTSSNCKGSVTPVDICAWLDKCGEDLAERGIHFGANHDYVSRSDDAVAMWWFTTILLGYAEKSPHGSSVAANFGGVPTAHIGDAIHLFEAAKLILDRR